MEAMVKNAADVEQVRDADAKSKRLRERELNDTRAVLSSIQGRRFVWRYLSKCGVFKSSWHPSAMIHFNEGMRNIGLELLADINEAEPEAYVKMMKESKGD